MPGSVLLIPFFLIRFGLLAALGQNAVRRAAHFPPLRGVERFAYWIYQITTVAILIGLFFVRIKTAPSTVFYAGVSAVSFRAILLSASMVNFAAPSASGLNQSGLYRLSRNPMYVAYFIYFIGCALLTQSAGTLAAVLAFQLSAHWIILAEERWCLETFYEQYQRYMERVRRYI